MIAPDDGGAALREEIRRRALAQGFTRAGFTTADAPLDDPRRLADWLAAGRHGSMKYLAQDSPRRLDPAALLPGARTVLVVATAYPASRPGEALAAYARLADYHREIRGRLARVLAEVQALVPGTAGRACVDTAPLLERQAAARAGLGWIGKNGLLLDVEHGPWLLLGELLLTLDLPPDPPAVERCGTCTRCLAACPTDAFVAPYVLDARRCLSYWTIEHRGPAPAWIRERLGTRWFGCDECLAACPFPARGASASDGADAPQILPVARELLAMTPRKALARLDEGFGRHFGRFAIARAGKAGLTRNCLTALGNGGDAADAPLVRRYLGHPDRGVRVHAAWALGRLGRGDADREALERARADEPDPEVRDEQNAALAALAARAAAAAER